MTNENLFIPKLKLNLFKIILSFSGAIILNSIPLVMKYKKSTSLYTFVSKRKARLNHGYTYMQKHMNVIRLYTIAIKFNVFVITLCVKQFN